MSILRLSLLAVIGVCLCGAAMYSSRSTAQAPPAPGSVTYRYDSLGRVVQDVYPANSGAYNYDAVGNRTAFTQN
jgi:YD repeat-containing protein